MKPAYALARVAIAIPVLTRLSENGDAYVPFLMKMLANPTGPSVEPQMIWPDFAKRFCAA